MDNNQHGSFGALSPDEMSAIKGALDRRGQGDSVPALAQQSALSATPSPVPPDIQGGVPPPVGGEMAQAVSPEPLSPSIGTPVGSPEAELIIKALGQRLKSLSNVDESKIGLK